MILFSLLMFCVRLAALAFIVFSSVSAGVIGFILSCFFVNYFIWPFIRLGNQVAPVLAEERAPKEEKAITPPSPKQINMGVLAIVCVFLATLMTIIVSRG